MKVAEDTPRRLAFTLGVFWFNGCRCTFDKDESTARIEVTNLFWRSRPRIVPLDDITAVDIVDLQAPRATGSPGPAQTMAYPQLTLRSGDVIALPSAGRASGEAAVRKIYDFLSADADGPPSAA